MAGRKGAPRPPLVPRAIAAPPKAERVNLIFDMMIGCKWETGRSSKKLADQWGMSKGSVENEAAEASRRVRSVVMDVDLVTAKIGSALTAALDQACRTKNLHAVAKLADIWAKVSGAGAPERHEVTGADGAPLVPGVLVVPSEDLGQFGGAQDGGQADSARRDLAPEPGTADPFPGKPSA